jgi:hypothetical protein
MFHASAWMGIEICTLTSTSRLEGRGVDRRAAAGKLAAALAWLFRQQQLSTVEAAMIFKYERDMLLAWHGNSRGRKQKQCPCVSSLVSSCLRPADHPITRAVGMWPIKVSCCVR